MLPLNCKGDNVKFWFVVWFHYKPIESIVPYLNLKKNTPIGSKSSTWQNIVDLNMNERS